MTELLSIRGYAKHRASAGLVGATHTAVAKAIQSGRLRFRTDLYPNGSVLIVDGEKRIDPTLADAEWVRFTDVAQQRAKEPNRGGNRGAGNQGPSPVSSPEHRPTQASLWGEAEKAQSQAKGGNPAEAASRRSSYLEARTKREQVNAERAELELKQLAAELVSSAEVRSATFEAFRSARDLLSSMLDRVSPSVAAESDPSRVRAMLEREIEVALASIVDLMDRPAHGENSDRS